MRKSNSAHRSVTLYLAASAPVTLMHTTMVTFYDADWTLCCSRPRNGQQNAPIICTDKPRYSLYMFRRENTTQCILPEATHLSYDNPARLMPVSTMTGQFTCFRFLYGGHVHATLHASDRPVSKTLQLKRPQPLRLSSTLALSYIGQTTLHS